MRKTKNKLLERALWEESDTRHPDTFNTVPSVFYSMGSNVPSLHFHPFKASIVAEAYDFVPDWAEVLYQQVILKGDFGYLEEFKQQKLLRPSIFEDISKK